MHRHHRQEDSPRLETLIDARKEIEFELEKLIKNDPQLMAEISPFIEVEACEIEEDEEIVLTLKKSYQKLTGKEPVVDGVSYFTDARFMVNDYGIPAVIFGPGSIDQAHAVDEYVEVEQLVDVSKVYAVTIASLLS